MLLLEPWTWSAEFGLGVTAFVLAVLGTTVWQFATSRGREGEARRLLSEYAVLYHVDPGVGRRVPADEAARSFARGRLFAWLWVLAVLVLPVVGGQWDRPEWAVPGTVLLAIAAIVQLAAREREARAGRLWQVGPPGPPRD